MFLIIFSGINMPKVGTAHQSERAPGKAVRESGPAHGDGWHGRRYDIALPLHYSLINGDQGWGESVNIGHNSLLMRCEARLPPGAIVEVDLAWPLLSRGVDAVVLRMHGIIESREGSLHMASLFKHEFLTSAPGSDPR
jgi:hypothetical protein